MFRSISDICSIGQLIAYSDIVWSIEEILAIIPFEVEDM